MPTITPAPRQNKQPASSEQSVKAYIDATSAKLIRWHELSLAGGMLNSKGVQLFTPGGVVGLQVAAEIDTDVSYKTPVAPAVAEHDVTWR